MTVTIDLMTVIPISAIVPLIIIAPRVITAIMIGQIFGAWDSVIRGMISPVMLMQDGIGVGIWISIITILIPTGIGTPIIMAMILGSVSHPVILITDLIVSGFQVTGLLCMIG